MTVTTIDPKTALIVIDLQKGIVVFPTAPHSSSEVIKNTTKLLKSFRQKNLPVVLVNVAGQAPGRAEQSLAGVQLPADFAELIPELDKQATDHLVTKQTWGAFTNTGLEEYLKSKKVTQVVIVGISTSMGVESTARQAHELGFNVVISVDSSTDLNGDSHLNSVSRIFPRLGETGTTAEILALVDKL